MFSKTFATGYPVVVEHTQCTEMYPFGVIIIGKTEGMMRIEPTMIGMSACFCFMNNCFHFTCFSFF